MAMAISIVILGLVSGCSDADDAHGRQQSVRVVHGDGGGPLSASASANVDLALKAPRTAGSWSGTFGSFLLCVARPHVDAIVIDRVRVRADIEPVRVVPYVRSVSSSELRSGDPRFTPLLAVLGSAPRFQERYVLRQPPKGRFVMPRGFSVKGQCPVSGNAGFSELLVSVVAGPAGAQVTHIFVDYSADGKPFTLRIDGPYALCGSDPLLKKNCSS